MACDPWEMLAWKMTKIDLFIKIVDNYVLTNRLIVSEPLLYVASIRLLMMLMQEYHFTVAGDWGGDHLNFNLFSFVRSFRLYQCTEFVKVAHEKC